MRQILPESVLEEVGKLDPAAIDQVRQEAWPDVRDADELHDVLHTLVALPVSKQENRTGLALSDRAERESRMGSVERSSTTWQPLFNYLTSQNRALHVLTSNN